VLVAAAAAVALFVREPHPVEKPRTTVENAAASSLRETTAGGRVRIGGVVATAGHVLHEGDAIEVEGTRAVLERPSKVTWLIEQGSGDALAQARVKSAGESLVLGLDRGVIEAQVVPVPSGEAFAVDIASGEHLARVAVHGTHLRVTRKDSHVTVDLTEGVVAIGVPPSVGVTEGTVVTAPAHVEFDVDDLRTIAIDRAVSSVRAAIPLGPRKVAPVPVLETSAAVAASSPVPPPSASAGKVVHSKAAPALAPRSVVVAAVRECAAASSRPGDVHVTVTSVLHLAVSSAGAVESARFVPPLSPEVQSCTAEKIYKLRLAETGAVTVPIEFGY
jgi:hypothetical protein